ncbi:MAG: peroxiredoxin, partial [Pyrinomonadaceae bacterium]|nr:peroxiredoxin [Pyrinomonadaceae bacterium]
MSRVAVVEGAFIGNRAPDFALRDGRGAEWRLSDNRGRVVVLFFYPGDETMTCTRQMCVIRERWREFEKTGAAVVGISMDTEESHRSFGENHKLPLRLLSDTEGRVVELYGVRSWVPGWNL